MNIQAVNSYTQSNIAKNQVSFKDADIVEEYIKTPYEKEMDSLYKQTQNQIELMRFFHKDNPVRMKKEIKEITNNAFKKAQCLKEKYLQPKGNFFQRLLKR